VRLSEADALFRRRRLPATVGRVLGPACPELVYWYPTYQFNVAQGRVSRATGR